MKIINVLFIIVVFLILVVSAFIGHTIGRWFKEPELTPTIKIVTQENLIEKETCSDWYFFEATAYTANDPAQGTNSIMASGKKAYEGAIAVDPKILKLGGWYELKFIDSPLFCYNGFYKAEDTGGRIKGNAIDIYMKDIKKATEFGRRNVWLRKLTLEEIRERKLK